MDFSLSEVDDMKDPSMLDSPKRSLASTEIVDQALSGDASYRRLKDELADELRRVKEHETAVEVRLVEKLSTIERRAQLIELDRNTLREELRKQEQRIATILEAIAQQQVQQNFHQQWHMPTSDFVWASVDADLNDVKEALRTLGHQMEQRDEAERKGDETKKELALVREQLVVLQQEIVRKDDQAKRIKGQLDQELVSHAKERGNHERRISEVQKAISEQQKKLSEADQVLQQSEAERVRLTESLQQYRQRFYDTVQTKDHLQQQLHDYTKNDTTLRHQLEKQTEVAKTLNARLKQELQTETDLRQVISERDRTNQELEVRLQREIDERIHLERELERKNNELTSVQNSAEQEQNRLAANIEHTEETVLHLRSHLRQLEQEKMAVSEELNNAKRLNTELEEKNTTLLRKHSAVSEEINELRSTLELRHAASRKQVEHVKKQLTLAKSRAHTFHAERDQFEQSARILQSTVDELQNRLEMKSTEVNAWRLKCNEHQSESEYLFDQFRNIMLSYNKQQQAEWKNTLQNALRAGKAEHNTRAIKRILDSLNKHLRQTEQRSVELNKLSSSMMNSDTLPPVITKSDIWDRGYILRPDNRSRSRVHFNPNLFLGPPKADYSWILPK